ncbi:MAG: DMT family transporter [Hyphomicrobiaceae bacterium]|nr:DMT family transporter [Hyphomicrobiaceae bacterium]
MSSNVMAAVRWMTVALFAFTAIAITGRGATQGLPTLDIMFYRGWLGTSILAIVWYGTGQRVVDLRSRQLPLIGFRSTVHFIAQFAWLQALALISLAELFAIEFTAPLWTALAAPFVLGERLTATRLAAAALGFLGILLVVRPATMTIGPGTLYAFVAAVGFAFHYLATKHLTRADSAFLLLFYTHLLQALMASVLVLGGLKVPDPATAAWVLGLTVLGLFAHYALARAFALADAIIVAPMDFLRLPLIAVVGVLVYSEPLEPMPIAGAAVIVAANFLNLWGERRHRK